MTHHTRWRGIARALGYSSYEIRQYSAISRGWFYREEFGKDATPNRLSTSDLAEHLERARKLLMWVDRVGATKKEGSGNRRCRARQPEAADHQRESATKEGDSWLAKHGRR